MEFERPYKILGKKNQFSNREVGLTHPDLTSFIRLADNGDIYIMAKEGLGIILSASKNSITLVGDTVKFVTKEDEGLKWNRLAFNAQATKYSEPAFTYEKEPESSIYDGVIDFLDD